MLSSDSKSDEQVPKAGHPKIGKPKKSVPNVGEGSESMPTNLGKPAEIQVGKAGVPCEIDQTKQLEAGTPAPALSHIPANIPKQYSLQTRSTTVNGEAGGGLSAILLGEHTTDKMHKTEPPNSDAASIKPAKKVDVSQD